MKGKTILAAVLCSAALLSSAQAAEICLRNINHCDRYRVILPAVGTAGTYFVRGQVYGCGDVVDKGFSGTLVAQDGTWYISITRNGFDESLNMAYLESHIMKYFPETGLGSFTGLVAYRDLAFDITGNLRTIDCPATAAGALEAAAAEPRIERSVR